MQPAETIINGQEIQKGDHMNQTEEKANTKMRQTKEIANKLLHHTEKTAVFRFGIFLAPPYITKSVSTL